MSALNLTCAQAATSYDDMPTYSTSADPGAYVYKTPKAHDGTKTSDSGLAIGTITGIELGAKISDYDYQADSDRSGAAFGLNLSGTEARKSGWFLTGDIEADYGFFQNTSNGSFLFDGRVMGGHDFLKEYSRDLYSISPEIGVGYRYVYGDTTDFFYLPVGIRQNIRLTKNSRISVNTEFDPALSVSDAYGLRADAQYQWSAWSVGPFLEYWNLSNASSDDTVEFGLHASYRF